MRWMRGCLSLLGLVAVITPALANPLFTAVSKLGETGFSTKSAPASSPTSFTPTTSRPILEDLIKGAGESADEQKLIRELITEIEKGYKELAKEEKLENDGSAALAFLMSLLHELQTGEALNEEKGWRDLTNKLRATLDTAEIRAATNAQKQDLYDLAIGTSGITVFMISSLGEDEKATELLREFAGKTLNSLAGIEAGQLSVKSGLMTLKARGVSAPSAPTGNAHAGIGGLAPSFTYTLPQGWRKDGAWHVAEIVDQGDVTRALVRFPEAIPAQGNMGAALTELWKQHIPKEGQGKQGSIVFRRYVGDRLLSQFICGRFRETGRDADTAFMLMLIDCKTHWQPVVIALTFDSTFKSGLAFSATFKYPDGMAQAENLLATFKCPPAAGGPLVDKEALVGDYGFGSGATQDWVNIYTGASSMTFVSYGGTLNLKADGKFTYTFSSASGAVGATTFRSAKGSGTWVIQGDQLICTYTEYDQGDGHKVKEHRYRIGGVTQFADGVKIVVLLNNLERPINVTYTGDSSNWYSTKKK
ncbi:MAG: hypothetical protein LCH41_14530 [Armatimonadetes bacterium]|nr:hypothetical protein [Armatimonadota bacterium]